VQIRYYDDIQYEYVEYLSASSEAVKFMQDNDEDRRIGMLVVWVDDGIQKDTPLVALTINLSRTLKLAEDLAFVGFTSSTGSAWEKHDILSWYMCEQAQCGSEVATRGSESLDFDYHLTNDLHFDSHGERTAPLLSAHKPADANVDSFDHRPLFPDTSPYGTEKEHFSDGRRDSGKGGPYAQVPHAGASMGTPAPTPDGFKDTTQQEFLQNQDPH
jgi:hypothetical protein